MMDLFITNPQLFASQDYFDGLESFELLVDYCDVFISCLDILMAPIHCRRSSDVMLNLSKSVDPMKKFSNVSKNNNFGQCNLWSDSKLPQVHTISSIVKTGSEHPPDICLPPLAALQKGPWAPWPGHFWGQTGRCSQRSNWPALLVHLHCNTVRWRGRIW